MVCLFVSVPKASAFLFGKKKAQNQEAAKPASTGAAQTQQAAQEVPLVPAAPPKAPQASVPEKVNTDKLNARRAAIEKKKQALNNTEWQIELTELGGKQKKEEDRLAFSDNQVACDSFTKRGFNSTNYTLTIAEDQTVAWETMQTSAKAGTAFWRGEIDPNLQSMKGALSYRIDDNTSVDYTFVSISKKNIPKTPPKEEK
jgi:hypothetical protein